MKYVYVVKIDYKDFRFEDRLEAMDFADMAKLHAARLTDVEIELVEEKKEEVEA